MLPGTKTDFRIYPNYTENVFLLFLFRILPKEQQKKHDAPAKGTMVLGMAPRQRCHTIEVSPVYFDMAGFTTPFVGASCSLA